MNLRFRWKSMPVEITSAQRTNPEMPSMSTESQTFMSFARLRLAARGCAACVLARGGPRSASRRTREWLRSRLVRDAVDLDEGAERERGAADGDACGRVAREELEIRLV